MSYPLRDQYHRARKALGRGLNRLWPSGDLAALAVPLMRATRPNEDDAGPAILPDQARQYLADRRGKTEEEAVYRLSVPVTVDPKMGILFHRGRVLWGSSDQPERERNPRFFSHLRKPGRVLSEAVLLHHVHGDNYFHFFLYVLSKAAVAEFAGIPDTIPLLVPEGTARTGFFKRAVEAGVFGKRQLIVQGKRDVVRVETAHVVRVWFNDRRYHGWIAERLRPEAPSGSRRLFVLRGANAANGRQFRNQDKVSALAQAYGFELVDPAGLDLVQQAALFSTAGVLLGAHGAGLTNLIFRAGAPCHIIELFSPTMGSPQYYMLARELGFTYESQMTLAPEGRGFTATTEVDLAELERALKALPAV